MKKEKKIPTILGLILLFATMYIGNVINRRTNLSSQAGGSCEPINPQVTNITNNSAVISFATSSDCLSTVSLTNRTINNLKDEGKIHYFEINSLEESKAYVFSIISGGKTYSSDNFNFKTGQKPNQKIPESNLAWGTVYNPDKTPANNSIIYFTVLGSSPLSALVTSAGNWNIPLSTSFNESLTDYFSIPDNTEENIVVIDASQIQTQVAGNSDYNNPVPDIIIGQNNFNFSPPHTSSAILAQDSLLDDNYDLSGDTQLTISNPKSNETISSKQPDFFGTANPGSKLKIKVESSVVINGDTQVGDDGRWNWSPDQDLSPGEHTITVTDENNNVVTRKFTVLAAESNIAFTASSSANSVTKTPTPTVAPKITVTPTVKPTIVPTAIPTKIPVSNPSTDSGIPQTGMVIPTAVLIILSIISIIFAFIYYKKI